MVATNGRRVKLTTIRVGKFRLVRPSDIDAFFEALSSQPDSMRDDSKRRSIQKKLAEAVVKSNARYRDS